MSALVVNRINSLYRSFRDLPSTRKDSLYSFRPSAAGVVGSGTCVPEAAGGVLLGLGETEVSAVMSNGTPFNASLATTTGIDFSKRLRFTILALAASQFSAFITARIQFRGVSTATEAPIDYTNWGFEVVINQSKFKLRACRLSTGGGDLPATLESAGTAVYSPTTTQCLEIVHDPAVGLALYAGTSPSNLSLKESIAVADAYPILPDTGGSIVASYRRTANGGVADTSARFTYVSGLNPMRVG